MSTQLKYLPGLIFVLFLFGITSCKKSNDKNEEEQPLAKNTFSLDGKTYTDPKIFYIESEAQLKAIHTVSSTPFNTVNSVTVTFSDDKMPTEGGTFDIVANPYSPGNTENNKELSISFSSFPYNYGSYYDDKRYSPKITPKQTATVTVDANRKVSVKFSNIVLINNVDASTTTASGNITQP